MKSRFIRCEFCNTEIASEPCELAVHKTTMDGEQNTFCCAKCAERYKKNKAQGKQDRAKQ